MTHEQLQDAHIAALRENVELRAEIERLQAELSTWRAKVEKMINLKGHIERELRGYGTPEEEIAKKAAWMKGKT